MSPLKLEAVISALNIALVTFGEALKWAAFGGLEKNKASIGVKVDASDNVDSGVRACGRARSSMHA